MWFLIEGTLAVGNPDLVAQQFGRVCIQLRCPFTGGSLWMKLTEKVAKPLFSRLSTIRVSEPAPGDNPDTSFRKAELLQKAGYVPWNVLLTDEERQQGKRPARSPHENKRVHSRATPVLSMDNFMRCIRMFGLGDLALQAGPILFQRPWDTEAKYHYLPFLTRQQVELVLSGQQVFTEDPSDISDRPTTWIVRPGCVDAEDRGFAFKLSLPGLTTDHAPKPCVYNTKILTGTVPHPGLPGKQMRVFWADNGGRGDKRCACFLFTQ